MVSGSRWRQFRQCALLLPWSGRSVVGCSSRGIGGRKSRKSHPRCYTTAATMAIVASRRQDTNVHLASGMQADGRFLYSRRRPGFPVVCAIRPCRSSHNNVLTVNRFRASNLFGVAIFLRCNISERCSAIIVTRGKERSNRD